MDVYKWTYFFTILFVSVLGGFYPFFKTDRMEKNIKFPKGEAFTAGVFLALSLVIMLPAAFHLFSKVLPQVNYPIASTILIIVFITLLAIEHAILHLQMDSVSSGGKLDRIIPVIMTIMIAIPSFLLGTALGVSGDLAGLFIFIAVIVHKGSAGFGLALNIVKSTLKRVQAVLLYCVFAVATPLGVLFGADMHRYLHGETMVAIKAVVLSMASGVFLYMSTLHGLRHVPMVEHCCTKKGFLIMMIGFIITALVRYVLGLAHAG